MDKTWISPKRGRSPREATAKLRRLPVKMYFIAFLRFILTFHFGTSTGCLMDPIKDIRLHHLQVRYPRRSRFKVVIEGACTLMSYCECVDLKQNPVFSVADIDDKRLVLILEEIIKHYNK